MTVSVSNTANTNTVVDNTTPNEYLYAFIGGNLVQGSALGSVTFGNCCP